MCYAVYISTSSSEDLAARNSELVRFEKLADDKNEPCTTLLEFPNCWFVGSKSGCSCTFRHATSLDLGFTDPVNWYPEERDHLIATRELYRAVADLTSAGYEVDLVDRWEGAQPAEIRNLDVWLDDVSETSFRMFENRRMRFRRKRDSRERQG